MTLYSTGMRRAELCHLRPDDIDSERMVIRIPHGKGRQAPRSPAQPEITEQLRTYYRSVKRRNGWLFPSMQSQRPDEPITDRSRLACLPSKHAIRAGVAKAVHPHTLRHYAASRTMPRGSERSGSRPSEYEVWLDTIIRHAA